MTENSHVELHVGPASGPPDGARHAHLHPHGHQPGLVQGAGRARRPRDQLHVPLRRGKGRGQRRRQPVAGQVLQPEGAAADHDPGFDYAGPPARAGVGVRRRVRRCLFGGGHW